MKENVKLQFNQLSSVLNDEVKVYRSLLDIVRKEKEILVTSHLDDLSENNRAKEAMILKLKNLENLREKSHGQLCETLGLNPQEVRLKGLGIELGGEAGEHLHKIHSVLELLIKRVHELNKSNEQLVNSALDNITGALKSIKNSLAENPTYKRKDKSVEKSTSAGQLVSREA